MESFEETRLQEKQGRDVIAEFMSQDENFNFGSFLRTVRSEPFLDVNADLIDTTNQQEFVYIARRAKAFLQAKPEGQERKVSIRCTESQMMWEPNVFSSGVKWQKVEEK